MDEDESDPSPKSLESRLVERDEKRVFLQLSEEDRKRGVIGKTNPSVCQDEKNREGPWPCVFREIKRKGRTYNSVTKFDWMTEPGKLAGESQVLLKPEEEYEKFGIEDARLERVSIDGKNPYTAIYVAYDGKNARLGAASISEDFREVKKQGLIGPDIDIRDALESRLKVGGRRDRYFNAWLRLAKKGEKKLPIKDGFLFNYKGKFVFIYRIEPDVFFVVADSFEKLRSQNYKFWNEQIVRAEENLFMKPLFPWERIKIGVGSLRKKEGRILGTWHGVSYSRSHFRDEKDEKLRYRSSIFEVKWQDGKPRVIRRLNNPLFQEEGEEYELIEIDEKGKIRARKRVNFLVDLIFCGNRGWGISGRGDREAEARSFSLSWLYEELEHPFNEYDVRRV